MACWRRRVEADGLASGMSCRSRAPWPGPRVAGPRGPDSAWDVTLPNGVWVTGPWTNGGGRIYGPWTYEPLDVEAADPGGTQSDLKIVNKTVRAALRCRQGSTPGLR